MLSVLRYLVWIAARVILSLRYRVQVHGLEQLRGLHGRTLILPNHPGMIDPPLVLTALWPALRPRPMLYEGNFRSRLLRPLMGLLNAVRIPDLQRPDVQASAQAQRAVEAVIDGLKKGENHI